MIRNLADEIRLDWKTATLSTGKIMTAGVEGVEPNSGETKQKWGGYQGYFVTGPDRLP